jgi:hypothetical protein
MDQSKPHTDPDHESSSQTPGEDLVEILALMERLRMTPADCLALLADVLRSFDEAERERIAAQHLDFPRWAYGLP